MKSVCQKTTPKARINVFAKMCFKVIFWMKKTRSNYHKNPIKYFVKTHEHNEKDNDKVQIYLEKVA